MAVQYAILPALRQALALAFYPGVPAAILLGVGSREVYSTETAVGPARGIAITYITDSG